MQKLIIKITAECNIEGQPTEQKFCETSYTKNVVDNIDIFNILYICGRELPFGPSYKITKIDVFVENNIPFTSNNLKNV